MWKQFVKDYFSFTKKDRTGIIVLVTLIVIVVILPYMWPVKKNSPPDKTEIEKIKSQVAQLKQQDKSPSFTRDKEEEPATYNYPQKSNYSKHDYTLFYFDPNTLNVDGWKRLGIRDKTAATIQNYLSKGGKFRKPEDLGKIYGLFKDDYERLLPYVKIEAGAVAGKQSNYEKREFLPEDKPAYPGRKTAPLKAIDINNADTAVLIAMPGIGSKLAARIVSFRDKLGGFYDVQQIAETYGLPDSTFGKIKAFLQCNAAAVHRFNINTADANTLKQHPYIRWNLANAIVEYRGQHGIFKSVDDLQQIAIVTPEIFQKIKAYLVVE